MQSLLFFLHGVWHSSDEPPNNIVELKSARDGSREQLFSLGHESICCIRMINYE